MVEIHETENVQIIVDSSRDTTLTLYDNSGSEIAFDDDNGRRQNAQIVIGCSENNQFFSGTYFVQVESYGDTFREPFPIPEYTIQIEEQGSECEEPIEPSAVQLKNTTLSHTLTLPTVIVIIIFLTLLTSFPIMRQKQ